MNDKLCALALLCVNLDRAVLSVPPASGKRFIK